MTKIHIQVGSVDQCDNDRPHYPHVLRTYRTVCYGVLENFCPGIPGPGAEFRWVGFCEGGPDYPAILRWVEGNEYLDPDEQGWGEVQGPHVHEKLLRRFRLVK